MGAMATMDTTGFGYGLVILLIPLLLALPMRLAWQLFVGSGHEASEYKQNVRQIIDSGHQVSEFRDALNDIARQLRLSPPRQRLIEADILHPLTISHFLLLPSLFILPLTFFIALPVILIGFPLMLLMEFLLIRQKVVIYTLKYAERFFHWQVIHIPRPYRSSENKDAKITELSQQIVHFSHVPQAAFLGLFAWLIVHWVLNLDAWEFEIVIAGVFYMLFLSVLSVLNTAFESDLVFVDPAKGRLVPVDQWLDSILKPIVGIGLLFLLGRNLLEEARNGGNPVLFSVVVILLLYAASVIGIAFRWGYSTWRGKIVRSNFSQLAIDVMDPLSYDLTRIKGQISLTMKTNMRGRLDNLFQDAVSQQSFDDLQKLPQAKPHPLGPDNPLELE
jgi:hypothetical protein